MLYNTGALKVPETYNSILHIDDVEPYIKREKYEIPLDYAFPVFGWGVKFENNKFVSIVSYENKDISNNDMHIIEAVGLGGGNMSSIAAKLKITVGSLTTSMNSLVKKGYVKRERSEKDRRVVFIQLTNKGRMAYHHHAEFHRQMTEAVIAELNENETEVLVKALDGLRKFFRQYHEQ